MEGYLITNADLFQPLLQRVASLGIRVVLDLSNFNIVNGYLGLLKEVIPRYVDILFANESESLAYSGLSAEDALAELMGEVSIAVITLGSRGALVGSGGRTFLIPAGDNAPIDTTGAGDHFAAGFLYGLSRGCDLESAARIGTLLADHVVGIVGAQISELDWDQIRLKVSEVV
jgi:sugar/nucleoside kinase (ribokinase family)